MREKERIWVTDQVNLGLYTVWPECVVDWGDSIVSHHAELCLVHVCVCVAGGKLLIPLLISVYL